MKYTDKKQYNKSKEQFEQSMLEYFKALEQVKYITPTTSQYNTLSRQIQKLTKTIIRIKDENVRGE